MTTKHPIQPIYLDEDGTARFKENKIVRFLLEAGPYNMNTLALMPFNNEDREHFAQLIGYSVSGFGDLSYTNPDVVLKCDEEVERLLRTSGIDTDSSI